MNSLICFISRNYTARFLALLHEIEHVSQVQLLNLIGTYRLFMFSSSLIFFKSRIIVAFLASSKQIIFISISVSLDVPRVGH